MGRHHGSYHRHLGNDDIVKQYDWCGITVWAVDESVVCEINVCVCECGVCVCVCLCVWYICERICACVVCLSHLCDDAGGHLFGGRWFGTHG